MIYGLIVFFFKPFNNKKWMPLAKATVTIFILWIFTLIAGSVPSILRSAVMFTFIVIGETMGKRSNIYNNLAASAFVILLCSPFSLWDVGFQLSYSAVLGIVMFSKSITNWVYFNNKILKNIWGLTAVTISAQVLTLPFILYHFHQFPLLFLFTNLLAVPFSGLILYIELFLLIMFPFASIAQLIGKITGCCIGFLNEFILRMNMISFAQITCIQITVFQTIILFIIIAGLIIVFLKKQPTSLFISLVASLLFSSVRTADFIQRNQQQKIIIYNVPQHRAVDIIEGRKYQFIGDSILTKNDFLRNFHLQPARILHRVTAANYLHNTSYQQNIISNGNKNIILIDDALPEIKNIKRIKADAILISKSPTLYISQLIKIFNCNQYIFDASNPLWKINKWKKDCDSLHLRHYSIPEQGAFQMEL